MAVAGVALGGHLVEDDEAERGGDERYPRPY